jgi:23S rRNA pseudouridine1911/1915/1917 synthase
MQIHRVRVNEALAGLRLDICLARALPQLTRAQIKRLIEAGKVRGPVAKPADRVRPGWEFEVHVERPAAQIEPQTVVFELIYADRDLAVVAKPAGLVVHPAPGHYDGTLVHGLMNELGSLSTLGAPLRPGIVHRLDKDTSGLLVVARTDLAYQSLAEQIAARSVVRRYRAIVCGHMNKPEGTIAAAIGRSRRDRKLMRVNGRGRDAVTRYRVLQPVGPCDLLNLTLESGRTHQIRVHLRHVGKPVFGDPTYGGRGRWAVGLGMDARRVIQEALKVLKRQALHAAELSFRHPRTEVLLRFESEPPQDMRAAQELLCR